MDEKIYTQKELEDTAFLVAGYAVGCVLKLAPFTVPPTGDILDGVGGIVKEMAASKVPSDA